MNGLGTKIDGIPLANHEHKWHFTFSGPFSSFYECDCGANRTTHYSPNGYIGNQYDEELFEEGSPRFNVGKRLDFLYGGSK